MSYAFGHIIDNYVMCVWSYNW